MLQKISNFFGGVVKSVGDYFVAHPAFKHLLDAALFAAMGAAWAYIGPLLQPGHAGTFSMQGLGFAVAGALKVWLQSNRDVISADTQDAVQAILAVTPAAVLPPPTTSSALTPLPKPVVSVPPVVKP